MMPFKIRSDHSACPEDPEALLRDLRKKTIPGLLSHQADLIRSYLKVHTKHPDIALQLPTGSGKTLVGLLIGEWRRRQYGERVVYLCPTNQLVYQVATHASSKYGIDVYAFTGSRKEYEAKAAADWQNAEALAITNYSSLFNTNPFFVNPHLIILDDAHSAENYISSFWSLLVDRTNLQHQALFSALLGILQPLLSPVDQNRFHENTQGAEDRLWVEKIPTPVFHHILGELIPLLDQYTKEKDLRHSWQMVRSSLHACHLYLSTRGILIRPLIPPTNTHPPFVGAKQRIYMSATLGAGGDLERSTGRSPIERIPIPPGWDKQGIGRRFFIFPTRALDEETVKTFTTEAMKTAGRSLYLLPDEWSARQITEEVTKKTGFSVFNAQQIEESKKPFVESRKAVAVIANRYDGIDLVDDDCRLLFVDRLPMGANLQERFLVHRVGAQLLLEDRVLTRIIQGFGRCTRSSNDYAAVVVLGENLNRHLFARERREFFHPEIQAELEFGLDQSKDVTGDNLLEYLRHFLAQDAEWDKADDAIVSLRHGLIQKTFPAAENLKDAVDSELKYQYALWNDDFTSALEHCRAVLGKLTHPELRGYRALWLYLAGSVAWLAHKAQQINNDEVAKSYFRQAQAAAPVLRWLVGLQSPESTSKSGIIVQEIHDSAIIERFESVLDKIGTTHDGKYDAVEREILCNILQDDDGKLFEQGRERLGWLLGFQAGHSDNDAAPDPWWIVDDSLWFVFEDHAEGKADTLLSVRKARQAASHPSWIRSEFTISEKVEIFPILITPCTKTTQGAIPHLKNVQYWHLAAFREWATNSLRAMREVRRSFPGPGNVAWRTDTIQRMKTANITPVELKNLLCQSAADAMSVVAGQDREDRNG